jgi:hypothetical protein
MVETIGTAGTLETVGRIVDPNSKILTRFTHENYKIAPSLSRSIQTESFQNPKPPVNPTPGL